MIRIAPISSMFSFGKNWQVFTARYLNEERIALAEQSLSRFLGITSLSGKTFIDVGAGSGISSLAALKLGASNVISFDVDPDCIACCDVLRSRAGNPAHWSLRHGSILDDHFISSLPQGDIVYAWGVLHHTGSMWKALEAAMRLVKNDGVLFLAIYNKADGLAIYPDGRMGSSAFWKIEKRIYASLPLFLQNLIDYVVMSLLFVLYLLMLRNPFRVIRDHQQYFSKGMSWRVNIKDWLGGYPYEYATVAEVFSFAKQRGFQLENLTCNNGLLNNEFLLRKQSHEINS